MVENTIIRSAKPALFIGLGGTGKQVLLQLRRMFLDHYGIPTLPHIAHLCIDTDTRNVNLEGSDLDEFLREVLFTAQERVDTPLDRRDLARVYENEINNPHIFSWFDKELKKHGNIKDGAGQIRSFGRLAFFLKANEIESAIKRKLSQIQNTNTANQLRHEYNITLDTSGVDLWFIFSIAGGTGSGMFLDVAYLAEECASGYNTTRQAVILLPTAFSDDFSHRIFANSYAALMELEYYNFPQREGDDQPGLPRGFRKLWRKDQFERGEIARPPVFDNAWLIGNAPMHGGGGFNPSQKTFLCEMIAEWLFLVDGGTTNALADQIISDRSNYTNELTPIADLSHGGPIGSAMSLGQQFSRHYSSFGLSKIFVATPKLANEAQHRLASDVLADWTTSGAIDPDIGRQLDADYGVLLKYGNTRAIQQQLALESGNTSIQEALRQAIDAKAQEFVQSARDPAVHTEIMAWLENQFLPEKLALDAADPNRRGLFTRMILDRNVPACEREILEGLNVYIARQLNTRKLRFVYAVEGLRYFIRRFEDIAKRAAAEVDRNQNLLNQATRDTRRVLEFLDGEGSAFARKTIIRVAFDHIRRRVDALFRRQVARAAEQLANSIVAQIGSGRKEKNARGEEVTVHTGLISSVHELKAHLDLVDIRIRKRAVTLRSQNVSPANNKIDAPGEAEGSFYVTRAGSPFTHQDVAKVADRILESGAVMQCSRLWDFRGRLDGAKADQFLQDLLAAVREDLAHVSRDAFDVVEILNTRYDTSAQDSAYRVDIERAFNKGSPMLEETASESRIQDIRPPPRTHYRIARSAQADPASVKRLEGVIDNAVPAQPQKLAGSRDTIYFESERVGIPLLLVPKLEQYKSKAYLGHIDQSSDPSSRVLHTELDFEKFPDLIPFNDEEVKRVLSAWEAFAEGVILGVVEGTRAAGSVAPIVWSYKNSEIWGPQSRSLGVLGTTIRSLSMPGSQHLQEVRKLVDARLNSQSGVDTFARLILIASRHHRDPPITASGWKRANAAIGERWSTSHPDAVERTRTLYETFTSWAEEHPAGSKFFRLQNGANRRVS
jgi:hypothetical protein